MLMLWMLPILAAWTHNAAAFAGQQQRQGRRSIGFGRPRPTAFFGQVAATTRRLRPPSPPGILSMGCDTYFFGAFSSSGNAILVLNKDIKEAHRPGSTSASDAKAFRDPLAEEELEWLFDQTKGFRLYRINNDFVLITKAKNEILECEGIDAVGNFINDCYAMCKRHDAPPGREYDELVKVARRVTPAGNKLSFAPGKYSFSATNFWMIEARELKPLEKTAGPAEIEESNMPVAAEVQGGQFPLDFELIIGQGEKRRTFRANKAVLCCFYPGMEEWVAVDALGLPGLDPEAVQLVLDKYSTRKKRVRMPLSNIYENFEDVELVKETFGVKDDDSVQKKHTEAFLTDPRWLDVTFLVGPNKEVVKGNRAVLASMNAVLCRILYGTETIIVDLSAPIVWSQFEAPSVQCVFEALARRGKEEVVVPMEHVESTKKLVDFLMETKESLKLYYETPFKREFEACLIRFEWDWREESLTLEEDP